MVTHGSSNGYLTAILPSTGEDGIRINIGKNRKLGVSVVTSLNHSHKGNNKDSKGSSNINKGLRFSNISNGDNNKDNTRVNNQDNNPMREFSNRKDKSKDLRFSKQDTLNLKENLKEESEVEKAGRIEVGGDTTISSNDI